VLGFAGPQPGLPAAVHHLPCAEVSTRTYPSNPRSCSQQWPCPAMAISRSTRTVVAWAACCSPAGESGGRLACDCRSPSGPPLSVSLGPTREADGSVQHQQLCHRAGWSESSPRHPYVTNCPSPRCPSITVVRPRSPRGPRSLSDPKLGPGKEANFQGFETGIQIHAAAAQAACISTAVSLEGMNKADGKEGVDGSMHG
jgi:hypothetical protein